MSEWKIALLLLFAARSAMAAAPVSMTIEPHGPIYFDDVIVLSIVSNSNAADASSIKPSATNATVLRSGRIYSTYAYAGRDLVTTNRFEIHPDAPGPVTVNATYNTVAGVQQSIPPISFNVLPALATADDTTAAFRKLRAAHRPMVIVRAAAFPPRAYIGQRVEVCWIADSVDTGVADGRIAPPVIPGVEVRESGFHSASHKTAEGGELVNEQVLQAVAIYAKSPGVVEVPPQEMSGAAYGVNPLYAGNSFPIRRYTNALRIEILPLPKEAGALPVGVFSLQCAEVMQGGVHWPQVDVTAKGAGDVSRISEPQFVLPPTNTVVIAAEPFTSRMQERSWSYEVHTRHAHDELPALELPYFNPAKGAVETTRCDATTLNQNWMAPGAANAVRPQKSADPMRVVDAVSQDELTYATAVCGALALLGLLLVVFALRP